MSTLMYKVRFTSKAKASEPRDWSPLDDDNIDLDIDNQQPMEENYDTLDFQGLTEKILDGDFLAKWEITIIEVRFEANTYSELSEQVYFLQNKLDDIQSYVDSAKRCLSDVDDYLDEIDYECDY